MTKPRIKKPDSWPILVKQGSVTAKIFRTPENGKDRFTVEWYEGTLRKRLTRVDLAEARREAKTIAGTLNAGRGAALELSGVDRDAYLSALAKLKTLKIDLAPAIEEYVEAKKQGVPLAVAAKFYAESHNAKLPDKTVSEVVEEMIAAKRKDGASRAYLAPLKTCLDHFAHGFKDNIAHVQTSDIDAWLRTLKQSPRSRNNHRNAVVLLFNFAKSAGYLNRDRTTAAEHTALARKKVEAIEVFTPADLSKLIAAANVTDKAILPFFVLGGFCGLRTVEASRLLWEDIRWPESSIVISAAIAKTRTRRLAPLTDTAAAWLADWKDETGRVLAVDKLHKRVGDICKTAGVTWKDNGLRHSFITYRLATLKDPVRVAFEAGNSPQVIRSNYDAVATEQEGKLWFSIMPKTAGNVVQITKAG
jgi:integrase-like protein/integrase family protein with SAM-like domain